MTKINQEERFIKLLYTSYDISIDDALRSNKLELDKIISDLMERQNVVISDDELHKETLIPILRWTYFEDMGSSWEETLVTPPNGYRRARGSSYDYTGKTNWVDKLTQEEVGIEINAAICELQLLMNTLFRSQQAKYVEAYSMGNNQPAAEKERAIKDFLRFRLHCDARIACQTANLTTLREKWIELQISSLTPPPNNTSLYKHTGLIPMGHEKLFFGGSQHRRRRSSRRKSSRKKGQRSRRSRRRRSRRSRRRR